MAGFFTQLSDKRSEQSGFSFRKLFKGDGEPKKSPYGGDLIDASGSQDKPAIDKETDLIMNIVGAGKAASFRQAYEMVEKDVKLRDYNLYVGRALKMLKAVPPGPMRDIMETSYQLPVTINEVENYNAAKRAAQGLSRDAMQVASGSTKMVDMLKPSSLEATADFYLGKGYKAPPGTEGNVYDPDTAVRVLDEKIEKIDANEMIWKSFNAANDPSTPSGIDLPLNIGGGIGEALLAMGTGFKAATAFTTRAQQIGAAFKLNTAYEGTRFGQHGNVLEAGVGLASGGVDFIPGLRHIPFANQTHGGQMAGNLLMSGERNVRDASLRSMGLNSSDTALHGLEAVKNGEIVMPFNILYRPNRTKKAITAKDKKGQPIETERQRIVNVKNLTQDFQDSSATMLKSSLDGIGRSAKNLDTPAASSHTPIAFHVGGYFNELTRKFKAMAKPYKNAYRAEGDSIRVPFSELYKQMKDNVTDSSAISHFNKAYRTVTKQTDQVLNDNLVTYKGNLESLLSKRNKGIDTVAELEKQIELERGTLNRYIIGDKTPDDVLAKKQHQIKKLEHKLSTQLKDNKTSLETEVALKHKIKLIESDESFIDVSQELTANQMDDFIKELNQQIYDKSASMSGAMTDKAKTQLGWIINGNKETGFKGAKQYLEEIPGEYAENYKQASKYYKANFDMLDESKEGSIGGLKEALKDKTGQLFEKLFVGDKGLNNLKKLGNWMLPNNPLYGTLVRTNIEHKIRPNTSFIDTINEVNKFDGAQLVQDMKDVNFDDYRSLVPIDSDAYKGINGLSATVGTSRMLGSQMKEMDDFITRNIDIEDLPYTTDWNKNWTDNAMADLGMPSEFPSNPKPESLFGQSLDVPGEVSEPSAVQKLKNWFLKTRAPNTQGPIPEGPTHDVDILNDVFKNKRLEATGFTEPKFVEQGAPKLLILDETPYTPKEIE